MTLEEKMARALYVAESSGGGTPWEDCLPGYRECMLRKVRPIIAVMLEEMRKDIEARFYQEHPLYACPWFAQFEKENTGG